MSLLLDFSSLIAAALLRDFSFQIFLRLYVGIAGAPCTIKNSNMKPGKACKCNPFYGGTITWKGAVASGKCTGTLGDALHAEIRRSICEIPIFIRPPMMTL